MLSPCSSRDEPLSSSHGQCLPCMQQAAVCFFMETVLKKEHEIKQECLYSNIRSLHMTPTDVYKGCGPAVRSMLMVVGAEVQSRTPGAAVSIMAPTLSM